MRLRNRCVQRYLNAVQEIWHAERQEAPLKGFHRRYSNFQDSWLRHCSRKMNCGMYAAFAPENLRTRTIRGAAIRPVVCKDLSVSEIDSRVLSQVASELGAYLCMLVDPRSREPFYVGKGQRLRYDSHYSEALIPLEDGGDDAQTASRKAARIREILSDDSKPEVWILRRGLTIAEYTAVEATVIDLLMSLPTGAVPLAVVPRNVV